LNNSTIKEREPEKPEDWISQAAAARIRGVSQQAIKILIVRGWLQSFKIGGKILVRRSEVESFEPMPIGRPSKKSMGKKEPKKQAKSKN